MKKIITTLTLGLALSAGYTQTTDTSSFKKNDIGVDFSYFVDRFISLSVMEYDENLFTIQYRRHISQKFDLRTSLGFSVYSSEGTQRTQGPGPNYADTTISYTSKSQNIAVAVGAEWKKQIGQKWQLFYGVDFVYSSLKSDYKSAHFDSKETSDAVGGRGLAGVRFNLSKNVSLTTETYVYATKNKSEMIQTDYWHPDYNGNQNSEGFSMQFTPPIFLYLNIAF